MVVVVRGSVSGRISIPELLLYLDLEVEVKGPFPIES